MSQQDGLGNNGPESTGLSRTDDGDKCMQEERENVAHAHDGIKPKKRQNSGAFAQFAYHNSRASGRKGGRPPVCDFFAMKMELQFIASINRGRRLADWPVYQCVGFL